MKVNSCSNCGGKSKLVDRKNGFFTEYKRVCPKCKRGTDWTLCSSSLANQLWNHKNPIKQEATNE